MDYKTKLEALTNRLVGRRIVRIRYDMLAYADWEEFGPKIDADVDSILLDLDGGDPASITWSSECGFSYGLSLTHERHWTDLPNADRGDGWATVDVTATSRWREVIGEVITEARVIWAPVLSEEVPNSAVTRSDDGLLIDRTMTIPSSIVSVPQELALRFGSGQWVVICAARYHGENKGLWAWMDELLVVHDDAFMREHQMGPHAPPPVEPRP